MTAGKGKTTGMYEEIFVSWIVQLFAFITQDIYPHTHTHNPRPLPTTYDPRHLATPKLKAKSDID